MAHDNLDDPNHDQQLVDLLAARQERLMHGLPSDSEENGDRNVDVDKRLLSEAAEFDVCLRLLEQGRRERVRAELEQDAGVGIAGPIGHKAKTNYSSDDSTIGTPAGKTLGAWLPQHDAGARRGAAEDFEETSGELGHFCRFEIQGELGRGGLGVVLLAYDPLLARHVALKIPRPEALLTPNLRQRFRRETQAAVR